MSRVLPVPSVPATAVSTTRYRPLDKDWQVASAEPDSVDGPDQLTSIDPSWGPATVPGTVAEAVGSGRRDALDRHDRYDAHDWWYRCSFSGPREGRAVLRFDGLATLATIWLNGDQILSSSNMFLVHRVDVSGRLGETNELVMVFRSLDKALNENRPRPRWKTRLVENQRLRWFRTTLLGRIPGWTPRIDPVGPWRGVGLECADVIDLQELSLRAFLEDGAGRIHLSARAEVIRSEVSSLRLTIGPRAFAVPHRVDGSTVTVAESVNVGAVEPWWPRSHGEPTLYEARLHFDTEGGSSTVDCGKIGFRTVEIDRTEGRTTFVVNGVPIFARGACWTTNDLETLTGDPSALERTLDLAAEANANMIRVGGTMVYESDDFYSTCDRLGLMVWQDFMFANMDYPIDDDAFSESIEAEASQQLARLCKHPSVVAFCGGSEIEQQAAMFGAPREVWTNSFFAERLPELVERFAPGTPYWSSTPTGGTMPFHVHEGIGHYFGVGAYKCPLDDARLSLVKFSPECLGFSNIPEADSVRAAFGEGTPPPHLPQWKAGVPRDGGAGWDFEDIRDHYLEQLFGVDAVELRSRDLARYYRISRLVTGHVMGSVFDEWRSPEHPCSGGLVWFLQDLRPGAGWGIIDSAGRPKPAWHFLRRAWASVRVALLDRGINGVTVEIHNDLDTDTIGELNIRIYGRTSALVSTGQRQVTVPARGSIRGEVEDFVGHFADPAHAYQFGPRALGAVAATLRTQDGSTTTTVFWPEYEVPLTAAQLEGELDARGEAGYVCSDHLVRSARIELKEGRASENYVDLLPGERVPFTIVPSGNGETSGFVEAENDADGAPLRARKAEGK